MSNNDMQRSGTLMMKFKDKLPDSLKGKVQIGISGEQFVANIVMSSSDDMDKRKPLYEDFKKWLAKLNSCENWLSDTQVYQIKFATPEEVEPAVL
jgi:hypothetical protein